MKVEGFLRGIILTGLFVFFTLLISTCGGGRKAPVAPAVQLSGVAFQASERFGEPHETTLGEALAELEALPVPEGVDESVFAKLKSALANALRSRGILKVVSEPPTGPANCVGDLELVDAGEGAYELTWHYRNCGDYNQDGVVSIQDITPLAVHFNENAIPTNEWIDGNADGVINIQDITPLAASFLRDCAGYSIRGADTQDGEFIEVSTVPFSGEGPNGRLCFTAPLPETEFAFLAVAPFDSGASVGELSQPVRITRGDWWMFGREPTHNRRSPYVGAQTPTLRWRYETEDKIGSSPAIGIGGTIYVGGFDGYLYAISPEGTLKWRYKTEDRVDSSPAVGIDGTVYVRSWDGYLYAIKPDGSLDWKCQTGEATGNWIDSSPAIGEDGTVYVGTFDGDLCAVHPDGTIKWRYETGNGVYSGPAIDADGTIYVGSDDHYIYAIKPDGTLKWQFETESFVDASPAIGEDGTVYTGSFDGRLYALKPGGMLKWSYETGGVVCSSAAIGEDGTVYAGSADDYLYAIDPDGSLKWHYQTDDNVYSSPAIGADGTIYVGGSDGYLYAFTPEGALKWQYETGDAIWSSPSIGADGTVYVGSFDGSLYAFLDPGSESPPSINWVSPLAEVTGEEVTFIADVWGTTPFTYSWDFGGGADPNTSTEAAPTAILGDVGEYNAWLTVTNAYGSDTFDFTLTVEEDRPEITWVRPGGSILAKYHYCGVPLCGITVYFYFDVSKRSGDVEVTATIADEQDTNTFPVEQGERYQLSVYVGVQYSHFSHHYDLTVSSPSATVPATVPMEGEFAFTHLGEIGVAPYEP